jgi:hypothetical protein
MKVTRRRPSPSMCKPKAASASLAGNFGGSANAHVIRASKSPYGARPRWGQVQYAQAAICAIYPHGLPKNFNASQLARDVRERLAKDPEYRAVGFPQLSRQTVLRAVALVRSANGPN